MFIWDEWPSLFKGLRLLVAPAEMRARAVSHRLIDTAIAQGVEQSQTDGATNLWPVSRRKSHSSIRAGLRRADAIQDRLNVRE